MQFKAAFWKDSNTIQSLRWHNKENKRMISTILLVFISDKQSIDRRSPQYWNNLKQLIDLQKQMENLQSIVGQDQLMQSLPIIIFLIFNSDTMKGDQIFDSSIRISEMQFQGLNERSLVNHQFLESSQMISKQFFSSQLFSAINDYSIKNPFNSSEDHQKGYNSFQESTLFTSSIEDPLYNVLHFMRGKSEDWNSFNDREVKLQFKQPKNNASLEDERAQVHSSQEEMKTSPNLFSTTPSEKQESEGMCSQVKGKPSTKNITKNMGKLLLKWIWRNRQILRHHLKWNQNIWNNFISEVKEWKKQNNLTRQFLRERWHGNNESSKIFRILSARFFRCQSLASIFDSNIEHKELHIMKRGKFLEGTKSPGALDTLN